MVSADVFEGGKGWIIPPHNEMAYSMVRPGVIAFGCEIAPNRYGETLIFDLLSVYHSLPESLRVHLERVPVVYTRTFSREYLVYNYPTASRRAFDRDAVEAACERSGGIPTWLDDGALRLQCAVPSVIIHPRTGVPVLSAQFYWGEWADAMIDEWKIRYADRWNRHRWRRRISALNRGDILLVDNARIAHCKLPHDGDRQLWTAFGDPFYIEAPRSNSEPPTPDLGEINLW
jgi:hypothetical protein